jgi:hypothetical protein
MVAAVQLLQLEILVRHQVQRALLKPEPDHTLRQEKEGVARRGAGGEKRAVSVAGGVRKRR